MQRERDVERERGGGGAKARMIKTMIRDLYRILDGGQKRLENNNRMTLHFLTFSSQFDLMFDYIIHKSHFVRRCIINKCNNFRKLFIV